MTDAQSIILFALAAILIMGAFCVSVIWRMQQTIDTLTNKVMAKDYREYTVHQKPVQTAREVEMEQLSWYDDPQPRKEPDA